MLITFPVKSESVPPLVVAGISYAFSRADDIFETLNMWKDTITGFKDEINATADKYQNLLGDAPVELQETAHLVIGSVEEESEQVSENQSMPSIEDVRREIAKQGELSLNKLSSIDSGIAKLNDEVSLFRSEMKWAMGGILHEEKLQNIVLNDIYKELRIPEFMREHRYYLEEGVKFFKSGHRKEALKYFSNAYNKKDDNPFVLATLGNIYLYYVDGIDFAKSEEYYSKSGYYYEISKKNQEAAESFFYAGIAAYLNKNDRKSIENTEKAIKLNPELVDALYNHAKFNAVNGSASGLNSLKSAIKKDSKIAIKVLFDKDFYKIAPQVKKLMQEIVKEKKDEIKKLRKRIDIELKFASKETMEEIGSEIRDTYLQSEQALELGTFGTLQLVLPKVHKAHDLIISKNSKPTNNCNSIDIAINKCLQNSKCPKSYLRDCGIKIF